MAIVRSNSEEGASKLRRAGADRIVAPYQAGARHMTALALRPEVVDLIETIMVGPERLFVEEILIEGHSPYLHRTLREADLRARSGALVLALRRRDGAFIGSPAASTRLEEGDLLICIGTEDQVRKLAELIAPGQRS